jgi:hypothetical protein
MRAFRRIRRGPTFREELDPTMEVSLGVLADGANVSQDGKLNILGIFNALGAANFPATHPHMNLVLCFEATRAEEGKTKQIEIQLADGDGQKLFKIQTSLVVPPGTPGSPIRMNHILALNGIRFPKAGDYVFNVLVGDDQKAAVGLRLVEAKLEQRVAPS